MRWRWLRSPSLRERLRRRLRNWRWRRRVARCGSAGRHGDGDVVLDEEVGGGVGGAPDELRDLQDCEGAFEGLRDAVVEGGEGEVGVLLSVVSWYSILVG